MKLYSRRIRLTYNTYEKSDNETYILKIIAQNLQFILHFLEISHSYFKWIIYSKVDDNFNTFQERYLKKFYIVLFLIFTAKIYSANFTLYIFLGQKKVVLDMVACAYNM